MRHEMMTYFRRETTASLLLVAVALLSFALSFRLWGTPWSAAGLPLIAVALVQLVVGGAILRRTPGQRRDLALRIVEAPAGYRAQELARMETVMACFRLYRGIEAGALAGGLLLALVLREEPAWLALGLALAAQALLMLAVDLLAEARSRRYVAALTRFLDPAAPVQGGVDLGE